MEYHYPIDLDWTNDEMVTVVTFFNAIEAFYEQQVERDYLMEQYRKFKKIVPGKAEEKQIFKEFEKGSGYNSYKAVKYAQENPDEKYLSANQK